MSRTVLGIAALLLATLAGPASALPADVIYSGGTIVTANDRQPVVQAIAVNRDKIVDTGSLAFIRSTYRGPRTRMVNLKGRTMIPGLIDPHSHFVAALAMATQVNVAAPPVGPARNPAEIVAALKDFARTRNLKPGDVLIGYGYDENLMPGGRALTRRDIDAAFPDNPVLVTHVSMHGAVLNSAAFAKYGISAATETPAGGIIVREPGSQEPAGLVMEMAYLPIVSQLPAPTPEQEIEQIRYAQRLYAAAGVTTAQDGATHLKDIALLKRAAGQDAFFIDVVAYPFFTDIDKALDTYPVANWGKYIGRLKLGGCKITVDGSPQGRTAFFTQPYLTGGPGGEKDWKGEPGVPQDVLNRTVKLCYDQGLQMYIHANGDAAIDMALKAHEHAAAGDLAADRRTTIIHSQFVRRDQLQKYVDYNLIPSFFTEHAFFFGDTHVRTRGVEQASFLSPMKSAIALGLRPTNHTDFNVAPIDQMLVLWSAVTRQSRSGQVIGPDERVSPLDALKAITINAAYQYLEEDTKGSIEPGKYADLVILSANPLTVKPDAIRNIKVLETIKQGRTIYRAKP